MQLRGFQPVADPISAETHTLVRARRSSDGAPVILVGPAREPPAPDHAERLRHELALRSDLPLLPGVLPARAVDGAPWLCLDSAATPLAALGRVDLATALWLLAELAAILDALHRHGVVHRNVQPGSILVDAAARRVWLDGFGLAAHAADASAPARGALAYTSPEQTGRMNRAVDHRSDLYSLGVVAYELLTGQPPWCSTDPLELIHAHLARTPAPPPEVPEAVARIVLRLLEKTPDARYQSAAGLRADLERCARELGARGAIAPFELGAHDVVDRFLAPRRLYGREREVEALTRAFERAVEGPPALALVAGYSGVGKTTLIQELYRPIVRQRGAFVSGKFDQVARHVPYGALIQAFRALTGTLLAAPDAQLAEHRARLLEALGGNGAVLIEVIPEIALIVGEQPAVPKLAAAEAQNRFRLVFQSFVGALARRDHPLVVFLDDLQWADPASLAVLEPLLTSPDVRHLLVVGAYRDNEVDATHLLARTLASLEASGARVERVVLGPLGLPALRKLIGDCLRRHDDEVAALAGLVAAKTEGNPFFVLQFLKTLSQDGLLAHDDERGRWSFRLDEIARAPMTGNVIDLMARRIARLTAPAQEVLTLAAAIGNPFDLATLALVGGVPEAETAPLVDEALAEGLVLRGAAPGELTFLHDRVQQAAYARLPEERRRALHLAAGRMLLARPERVEERIFEVVGHLDRGRALIVDPGERRQVALLMREAGRRAKSSAAYQAALGYFSGALELLGDWERDHELCFELGREVAEHESLCGRFDEAERRFEALLGRARSPLEAAQVHDQRLLMYENRSRFAEAARIGLEGLRLLGCELPEDDAGRAAALDAELAAIAALLDGRSIASLIDLPLLADAETRLMLRLLTDAWAPAYVAWGAALPSLISARMVRLSIQHGHCEDSAYGYVTHAITVGPTRGDYAAAYEWGTLALAVNERLEDVKLRAKVHQQFNAHVTLWRRPLESCAVHAREAWRSGVTNGDFVYAAYGAFTESWPGLLCSRDLERFVRELTPNVALLERLHTTGLADALRVMLAWARALQGRVTGLDEAAFEAAHGGNPFFMTVLWTSRLHRALLAGEARAAVDASRRARRGWGHGTIFPVLADAWGGLARAALLDEAPPEERAALRGELDASAAALRVLAGHCPENFRAWSLLLDAERARLDGDLGGAVAGFEEAVRQARRGASVQHEALAHERCARMWLLRGADTVAEVHLGEARRCLRAWGAAALVRRLDEAHPRLRWRAEDDGAAAGAYDVESVSRAARALSGEIVQPELLRTLLRLAVENAGAGRGVFLADDVEVEADHRGLVEPERRVGVARSVVQYVRKTGQSLVLGDATVDERFAADPYVQAARPRSILCLPVVHQGKTSGILYLENNLAADAFTGERIRVLEVLSAQAAISLENARLYREKSEEVERRRRAEEELRAALAEVESLKNRLEAENVYLQEEIRSEHNFEEMVGQSPALRAALRTVERVAPTDSTVLITGETGTGKELIARAIHDRSRRRERPLVKVNCGAIAAGLVESELFGHVKGAFTGALERRIGRFELAQGGTIFLDEIGEIPLETQVKLLRVLQEQELEPVGSSRTVRVDARVIAATNRDLAADVRSGKFRSDLFYRLNVLPVTVPPLRERRTDIPQLVAYFVARFARRLSKPVTSVSRDTMELLVAYDWPGNVRELQNVIERAVVLASGTALVLDRDLLPASLAAARPLARASASPVPVPVADATPAGGLTLEEVERRHIVEVLARTRGVIEGPGGAAKILDMHPNTLRSRMKKLGISRGDIG